MNNINKRIERNVQVLASHFVMLNNIVIHDTVLWESSVWKNFCWKPAAIKHKIFLPQINRAVYNGLCLLRQKFFTTNFFLMNISSCEFFQAIQLVLSMLAKVLLRNYFTYTHYFNIIYQIVQKSWHIYIQICILIIQLFMWSYTITVQLQNM